MNIFTHTYNYQRTYRRSDGSTSRGRQKVRVITPAQRALMDLALSPIEHVGRNSWRPVANSDHSYGWRTIWKLIEAGLAEKRGEFIFKVSRRGKKGRA